MRALGTQRDELELAHRMQMRDVRSLELRQELLLMLGEGDQTIGVFELSAQRGQTRLEPSRKGFDMLTKLICILGQLGTARSEHGVLRELLRDASEIVANLKLTKPIDLSGGHHTATHLDNPRDMRR